MAREKTPKTPPKNPKREEVREWDQIIDGLFSAADWDERFTQSSDNIEQALDKIEADGNTFTRFKNYLNFLGDTSLKEVESKRAKMLLIKAKLDGSHWGKEDEDIEAMNMAQLKDYAARMKWEGPYPRKKADLLADIRRRLEGDDGNE